MPGLLSWVVTVIRDTEYEASDVVPGPGSNVRHPFTVFPSLHRVPAGPVPRLHQYYEGATTSCRPSHRTSLPSFGGTSVALVSLLLDGRAHRRGLELVTRCSSRVLPRKRQDLPSSWGTPIVRLHMFSRRRQDCLHQTITMQQRGPWSSQGKGSHERSFDAQ